MAQHPRPQPRTDRERLAQSYRLIAEQRSLCETLGQQSLGNVTLQLVFRLYISHLEGTPLSARDLIAAAGPSPTVTWRWLMLLIEDRTVTLAEGRRDGPIALTAKGVERMRIAVDGMAALTQQELVA